MEEGAGTGVSGGGSMCGAGDRQAPRSLPGRQLPPALAAASAPPLPPPRTRAALRAEPRGTGGSGVTDGTRCCLRGAGRGCDSHGLRHSDYPDSHFPWEGAELKRTGRLNSEKYGCSVHPLPVRDGAAADRALQPVEGGLLGPGNGLGRGITSVTGTCAVCCCWSCTESSSYFTYFSAL